MRQLCFIWDDKGLHSFWNRVCISRSSMYYWLELNVLEMPHLHGEVLQESPVLAVRFLLGDRKLNL